MNVIVTGAGKGIGFEIANQLAKTEKVIAISRDVSNLKETENLIPISYDLTNSLDELMNQIKKIFNNKVDRLINNAGALINKSFEEITQEDLLYIYKVNLNVPFLLTQALIPALKNGINPHVINVGSMGGVNGTAKFPGLSAYSSSKGALSCLTECLAEEYKGIISFNCLALGAVQTEMLKSAFPGYEAPLSAFQMAEYISEFTLTGHKHINGKTIPVSLSTP